MRQVLMRLSERQRDCLVLRANGLSYAEIAVAIGVAPGSVGTLLARAERAFKAEYLAPAVASRSLEKKEILMVAEAARRRSCLAGYDEGLLKTYLDAELPAAWREQLAAHIPVCVACNDRLARLRLDGAIVQGRLRLLDPAVAPRSRVARYPAGAGKSLPRPPAAALLARARRPESWRHRAAAWWRGQRRPPGPPSVARSAGVRPPSPPGSPPAPCSCSAPPPPSRRCSPSPRASCSSSASSGCSPSRSTPPLCAAPAPPAAEGTLQALFRSGTYSGPQEPRLRASTPADASRATGLTVRGLGQAPRAGQGRPQLIVSDPISVTFTYDAQKLAQAIKDAGRHRPRPARPAADAQRGDRRGRPSRRRPSWSTAIRLPGGDARARPAPGDAREADRRAAPGRRRRAVYVAQIKGPSFMCRPDVDARPLRRRCWTAGVKSGAIPPSAGRPAAGHLRTGKHRPRPRRAPGRPRPDHPVDKENGVAGHRHDHPRHGTAVIGSPGSRAWPERCRRRRSQQASAPDRADRAAAGTLTALRYGAGRRGAMSRRTRATNGHPVASAGRIPAPPTAHRPPARRRAGLPGALAVETHGLRKEYGRKVAVANLSLARPRRRGLRLPRAQRRRQDDHGQDAARPGPPHRRHGAPPRPPAGDPAARARMGFLPEQFRFHEWLTRRRVARPARPPLRHGRRASAAGASTSSWSWSASSAPRQRGARTYSKGMLQRVGMAQALIDDPELVFLDEPTSGARPARPARGARYDPRAAQGAA